jgi:hypothetical protein
MRVHVHTAAPLHSGSTLQAARLRETALCGSRGRGSGHACVPPERVSIGRAPSVRPGRGWGGGIAGGIIDRVFRCAREARGRGGRERGRPASVTRSAWRGEEGGESSGELGCLNTNGAQARRPLLRGALSVTLPRGGVTSPRGNNKRAFK